MRFLLLSSLCVLISADLVAQQAVFRSQNINLNSYSTPSKTQSAPTNVKSFVPAQDSQTQVVKKKIAPRGVNIHLLPLFGDFEKTDVQKSVDEEFLKACDSHFKTRNDASEFFSTRAWEYLSEGQKDTATYRFNLAYLLDNKNADVYWGLGVIAYQNEKYGQAIELMHRGLELEKDDNVTLIVDLATVYIKCFTVDSEKKDLQSAFELLTKALTKQPDYANGLMQLSLAKLLNEEVDEAWERFHQGYELDPDNASVEILEALLSKKEDPRGVFKKKN
ncbi:Tetratricopeptide TPR_2 repeat-containing protein [Emticicia oligotrophica DSM 17448]|uniref:Tetratricopeptide TPR_2 repeat-containing protein n=1 Tax=Emticicia oligotrophica (strain DSM 17448 / CIP 109782 / MTCC 6937 / GPTSA100-15) TaxID=929562 RepID=A0ABN4AL12_EMTOG|nr:Tetratricopeptide TPR_2 repeat-containing protein [Emticicia oligotrophica]AFK02499.1 Tetratricopeptide TPR_2 repeat-containing protein [Emticicia oligotrophica DSM 17448]